MTTTKQSHTKTPWKLQSDSLIIKGEFLIAETYTHPYQLLHPTRDVCEENALFIVKAVNNHDKLVKTIKWISERFPDNTPYSQAVKLMADEALQQVESES